MIWGNQTIEATQFSLIDGELNISKHTLLSVGRPRRHMIYLGDIAAGTPGTMWCRGVIYDDDGAAADPGTLIAYTEDIAHVEGIPPAWYPHRFLNSPIIQPGDYWIGVHAGGPGSDTLACYRGATASLTRGLNGVFGSAPPNPFGSGSVLVGPVSNYIEMYSKQRPVLLGKAIRL